MIRLRGRSRTLVAAAPLVLLAANAAAAGRAGNPLCRPPLPRAERYSLSVVVCGPTHVTRNTKHTYEVVVQNYGPDSGTVTLSVIHYDPITSSSSPFRRAYSRLYREPVAIWTVRHFRPYEVFRVGITLPIKPHDDPKGSNLMVRARGHGPNEHSGATKDIFFVR